jgi:hypothetical protein
MAWPFTLAETERSKVPTGAAVDALAEAEPEALVVWVVADATPAPAMPVPPIAVELAVNAPVVEAMVVAVAAPPTP